MFHGYYEQYQYLPIVITCAENDLVLLVGLRHGTCHASLGADDDLRYLVGRLRAVWPDVHIHVRGDSGLGVPRMYDVCRELRLDLHLRHRHELAAPGAERRPCSRRPSPTYERTGQPQRSFLSVEYQAESWPAPQPVVIKVEAHAQGTNRRAVVTNRPGCARAAAGGVRRVRDAGREREPQQGAEVRAGRPTGSATTGSWRTTSGCTCTRPR